MSIDHFQSPILERLERWRWEAMERRARRIAAERLYERTDFSKLVEPLILVPDGFTMRHQDGLCIVEPAARLTAWEFFKGEPWLWFIVALVVVAPLIGALS